MKLAKDALSPSHEPRLATWLSIVVNIIVVIVVFLLLNSEISSRRRTAMNMCIAARPLTSPTTNARAGTPTGALPTGRGSGRTGRKGKHGLSSPSSRGLSDGALARKAG